jgi:hypothetical protein
MNRLLTAALVGLCICAVPLAAQDGIQRGAIKKMDAARGVITVVVEGKEIELLVIEETKIWDAGMQEVADRLKNKGFREGAHVMFKTGEKDGKTVLVGLKLAGEGGAKQPPGPSRAKIKSIDVDKMQISLMVDGKEQVFTITENTRIVGVPGKSVEEQLKSKELKTGTDVQFLPATRDGKTVLVGLRVAGTSGERQPLINFDTSKLKPLSELGKDEYQGFAGGLYPDGKNERPKTHEAAGIALARKVQPLDERGKPSSDGKIVLLSIGMSNTTQEFSAFKSLADADDAKNPRLTLVDGAQGGMTASRIRNAEDQGSGTRFWQTVDQRLATAGATAAQVQIAWIKEADAGPNQGFPGYARQLEEELISVVQLMHTRFPNLKMVYLSSRIYAGYARTALNPEPYAYESGFSVKWLIEKQLKGNSALTFDPDKGGKTKAPWLSWGPYLWANGTKKNADGLMYAESDFAGDGTHPSRSGQSKVAEQLLRFFKNDTTTKPWFVKQ